MFTNPYPLGRPFAQLSLELVQSCDSVPGSLKRLEHNSVLLRTLTSANRPFAELPPSTSGMFRVLDRTNHSVLLLPKRLDGQECNKMARASILVKTGKSLMEFLTAVCSAVTNSGRLTVVPFWNVGSRKRERAIFGHNLGSRGPQPPRAGRPSLTGSRIFVLAPVARLGAQSLRPFQAASCASSTRAAQ